MYLGAFELCLGIFTLCLGVLCTLFAKCICRILHRLGDRDGLRALFFTSLAANAVGTVLYQPCAVFELS